MFTNILIGVDGRQGGRDAIAVATTLARRLGALTLAHVERDEGLSRGSTGVELREDAWTMLTAARDEAAPEAGLRQVRASTVSSGLHAAAEAIGADLLVIGSCHHGRAGRVLLGDDTRATLGNAPCAVAVAPAGYASETRPLREVGVGYDGSVESDHALVVARQIASEHGAQLSAYQALRLPVYGYTSVADLFRPSLETTVEQAHDRLRALGVEPHAAYGTAREELAFYSRSLDLLVIGSREHGAAGRVVDGSTARALSRSACCPLLVLTRCAGAADQASAVGALGGAGSVAGDAR